MQNGVTASGGGCSGETPISRWNTDFSIERVRTGHREWQRDGPWSLFQMQREQIFLTVCSERAVLHSSSLQAPVREIPGLLVQGQSSTQIVGVFDYKLVCCLFFLLLTAHREKELWTGEWCAEKPLQKQENRTQPWALMVFAVCSACVCPCQEMQKAQSSKNFSFCLKLALLGRLGLIKSKDSLHQKGCK